MNGIIRCILLLVLVLPRAADTVQPVQVVIFTPEHIDATDTLHDVQAALDYWQYYVPQERLPVIVSSTQIITATTPHILLPQYDDPIYKAGYINIYLVAGVSVLGEHALGYASGNATIIVYGNGSMFRGVVEHELGHVLHQLPDQYQDPRDIMGLAPWGAGPSIGCTSLAILNRPCSYAYIPIAR